MTSDKEKRLPFTAEHWRGIRHGLQVNSVDPEIKIAIRVLTCTGARPLEVGGLMADEVHNDHDGVWIDIRVNEIRGTKTIGSPRRLPIVDPVLAADLWALAEKRKGKPLFQKGFHTTSNLSDRLNKFLRNKCGIPKSPRTVVYSFRHSMRQALRVAEVPDYIANHIYAHAGNKISDGYGASNVELIRLKEAIEKALPRLGEVDLRDYAEDERGLTMELRE